MFAFSFLYKADFLPPVICNYSQKIQIWHFQIVLCFPLCKFKILSWFFHHSNIIWHKTGTYEYFMCLCMIHDSDKWILSNYTAKFIPPFHFWFLHHSLSPPLSLFTSSGCRMPIKSQNQVKIKQWSQKQRPCQMGLSIKWKGGIVHSKWFVTAIQFDA